MKPLSELKKEIINETLKEFIKTHELNLKNIGGWDKNDFIDYSTQLLDKALLKQTEEIIEIIDEFFEEEHIDKIQKKYEPDDNELFCDALKEELKSALIGEEKK